MEAQRVSDRRLSDCPLRAFASRAVAPSVVGTVKQELSEEHRALGYMLKTSAWEGLYRATIAERVKEYYRLLIDPSLKRKESLGDDFLRGAIHALQWAVTWPEQEMTKAAAELLQRASEEVPEEQPLVGGSRPPIDEEENLNG